MHILYNSQDTQYKTPFGVLTADETCTLHIRVPREIEPRYVQLVLEKDDRNPASEFPFVWAGGDGEYELFKCEFSLATICESQQLTHSIMGVAATLA